MSNAITHKFSNYLTPLETYANLWLDRLNVGNIKIDELIKTFQTITNITEELNLYIDSSFKLARYDMKIFDVESLNVFDIVDKASSFMQEYLNTKKLKIINNIPKDLIVYGNNFLIREVVENLISNAVKYSYEGAEIICGSKLKKNKFIRFTFDNKSEQIPKHLRKMLFKPYFRLLRNSEVPGDGLGLAICSAIIKRHNGKICVVPFKNNRNIFYFTLPAFSWSIETDAGMIKK